MKHLALIVAVAFFLPIYGQGKSSKPDSNQTSVSQTKTPEAQSTPTVGGNAVNQETPSAQSNGTDDQSKGYLRRLFSPENLPNIGLLLAGIIGIAVAIQTLKHMQESAERQMRAYVVAEVGSIVNIADPIAAPGVALTPTEARAAYPWGPIARIQIKNTGQTPAFRVEHWGNICFREYPLTSPLPSTHGGRPMPCILGPGIIGTKLYRFGPVLTDQQIADLRVGTGAIYVYGDIGYEDAFGKKRFTNYRLMYHAFGGAIGVSTDLTFTEEGNDAN